MMFIVDAMLGNVALWLRLAGEDTVYAPDIEDDTLLKIAESENRVVLTADGELQSRAAERGIRSMLVRGPVDYQIAHVFREFGISTELDPNKARCSKCNGELERIDSANKERVREQVFEQTYNAYDTFWLCRQCNTVFFEGAHWKNIREYMQLISEIILEENYHVLSTNRPPPH